MENFCTNRILRLALLKHPRKIIDIPYRSAVDLAHKVYGSGHGIPVIVLHGLLGSKRNWDSMCKKINSTTKKLVVAADARNHGESPHVDTHSYPDLASDVSQLMNKLSINNANIIGHSMGGRTAMFLALTDPAKVASLVIVDISPVSTAGILNDFFPRLLDLMKTIQFTGMDLGQARTLARQTIKTSGLIEHEALMSFIIMNIGNKHDGTVGWMCNIDVLKANFNNIATFPELSGNTYDGPALFIGGEQSNYIPRGDIHGIKKIFPNAELTYVPRVGHNVHAEDPTTFHRLVADFLK